VFYLVEVGLTNADIELLLAMTLVGDTIISLWITTVADRLGRQRMLIAGAALMVLGGVVFAVTGSFVPLLLAATIGVISPSGNEVGPFLAIEQAALAQAVEPSRVTRTFAWYNLTGAFATAAGALVCGHAVQELHALGWSALDSYRGVMYAYAAAGLLLMILFGWLSHAIEAPVVTVPTGARLFLGLHRSRRTVLRLAALFTLDAFAGGLVIQSLVAYWFVQRFGAEPRTLGRIFFGANLLAGMSALTAAALAARIGLLRTMVFTHVPSNVLLILLPFMPTLPLAITVLLLRYSISQMDVPARQSYTAAVVDPDERSAAAGVTGVARTTGAAASQFCAGLYLGGPALAAVPFIAAGGLKLLYDGLLFVMFQRTEVPGETRNRAKPRDRLSREASSDGDSQVE
jgi:MFS family permease